MATPSQYNPNIPQPTDLLSNSQPQLLVNFQSLQAWIDVNHVDYADNLGNAGKHLYVTMPNTASYGASPYPFNATDVGFYNNTGLADPNTLWFHPAGSNTNVNDFPLGDNAISAAPGTVRGCAYLTNSGLFFWNQGTTNLGGTTVTIPVNAIFPTYKNTIINVQVQQVFSSGNAIVTFQFNNFTATTFDLFVTQIVAGTYPVTFIYTAFGT